MNRAIVIHARKDDKAGNGGPALACGVITTHHVDSRCRRSPQVELAWAEDPGLGGSPVNMWSYPVIKDGLIYVIDIRNGLYVLRYHGRFEAEISQTRFNEGNSNLRD